MTYGEWKNAFVDGSSNISESTKNFNDVTKEWFDDATPNSHTIKYAEEFLSNSGKVYKISEDNGFVNVSKREKEVAELLENKFGGEIELVPEFPGKIKTPDYLFRKEKVDLKELNGESEKGIYNAIHKKKEQASSFVIDISKIDKSINDIEKQVEYVYSSKYTYFVDKIFIVKNDDVLRVYKRNIKK